MELKLDWLKRWAKALKRDVVALWIAARDPRTPWYAKVVAVAVAAYALSPIDLIPDFVPVLGYLGDLTIVPLEIALAVRLISPRLMAEYRDMAAKRAERPVSHSASVIIIGLWLLAFGLLAVWTYRQVR